MDAPIVVTLDGIVIDDRAVHPLNVLAPNDVTDDGIVIDASDVQVWNILVPRDVIDDGSDTDDRPVQPLKALVPIDVTVDGNMVVVSTEFNDPNGRLNLYIWDTDHWTDPISSDYGETSIVFGMSTHREGQSGGTCLLDFKKCDF